MKTLYLLRHAKAESGSPTLNDEDRKLSARGRAASERMGKHMKTKSYLPQAVLCSSAARTRETCQLITEHSGGNFAASFEKKLYLATAGEMLTQIHKSDDALNSLMLVGHNPGMHHLAALLASADHTPLRMELEMKYPTGALTVISFPVDHWSKVMPDSGSLRDFVLPDGL